MNPLPIVSNSSPLIVLARIGHLDLLERLFTTVVVPPAVTHEVVSVVLPTWVIEKPLMQPVGPRILRASLGAGESEAISLALEVGVQWIILDDRPARRLAEALGLPVIGTLGVLLAGYKAAPTQLVSQVSEPKRTNDEQDLKCVDNQKESEVRIGHALSMRTSRSQVQAENMLLPGKVAL